MAKNRPGTLLATWAPAGDPSRFWLCRVDGPAGSFRANRTPITWLENSSRRPRAGSPPRKVYDIGEADLVGLEDDNILCVVRQAKTSGKQARGDQLQLTPAEHAAITSALDEHEREQQQDEADQEEQEEQAGEVERVLARRGRGQHLEYQIRWKGFGAKDDSWEPLDNLGEFKQMATAFDRQQAQRAQQQAAEKKTARAKPSPAAAPPPIAAASAQPAAALSDYELKRQAKIAANHAMLELLGLNGLTRHCRHWQSAALSYQVLRWER